MIKKGVSLFPRHMQVHRRLILLIAALTLNVTVSVITVCRWSMLVYHYSQKEEKATTLNARSFIYSDIYFCTLYLSLRL